MISYVWFVEEMEFQEKTAQAMARYMDWELDEMMTMSDVDIAHRFQAGVHLKLFTPRDVQQLVEMMDHVYKGRTQTGEFLNLCDFLTESLELGKDQAHCMAFYLNMSPRTLLQLPDDEISFILFPATLQDWLHCNDITLLLRRLETKYPNRLQGNIMYVSRAEKRDLYTNMFRFLTFKLEIPSDTARRLSRCLDISPRDMRKLDLREIRAKLQPAVADGRVSNDSVNLLVRKLRGLYPKFQMQAATASSCANPYVV